MSETIERLRAEVERAGGGHRGYLLAAEKAVVERDALQRRVDVAWLTARDWRIRAETAEAERDALRERVQDMNGYKHCHPDVLLKASQVRAENAEAEVERLTDLCQRNSDDLAFLDDARALYTPRRGEVCVICGHEAVSIPPRWQHYMVAGRERAICATCVEGALFAALPVKP